MQPWLVVIKVERVGYIVAVPNEERRELGETINPSPMLVTGNPEPYLISASHVERQNLTIRVQLTRFTRLTNGSQRN